MHMLSYPQLQAHRGVSTDRPENTMSAFRAAVEQGYPYIELDPALTADGVPVILHDHTLARTARTADGEIPDARLSELTYREAAAYDYGSWFSETFRGEHLPTLREVLDFAQEYPVTLKLDNRIWGFSPEALAHVFSLCADSRARVGITCARISAVEQTLRDLPQAEIHYDGAVCRDIVDTLLSTVPNAKEKLVIWLPYPGADRTWSPDRAEDLALCDRIRKHARLGIWILSRQAELDDAIERFAPDIVETTGALKPYRASTETP